MPPRITDDEGKTIDTKINMGERDIPVALFEAEIEKVTRTFGRDHGVNVVFQGNEARTEGNTVYFPMLDQSAAIDPERVKIGRGYVDHEAAHIRDSNMPLLEGMNKTAMKAGDHLFANVMNALEDIRLERNTNDLYPGAMKNLEATSEAVYNHFLKQGHPTSTLSDHKMMAGITMTIVGRKAMGYRSESMERLLKLIDPALITKADGWLKLLTLARTGRQGTDDVVDITKKIVHDLRYNPPEEDEKPTGGNCGNSGEGGEAGEGTGGDAAEMPDSGHVKIEGETSYSGGGGIGAGGTRETLIVPEDFSFEDDGTRPPEGGLPFTSVFGDLVNTDRTTYRPFTKAGDKWHTAYDEPGKYRWDGREMTLGLKLRHLGGARAYQDTVTGATGKVNVIRRKLNRLLMSKMQRDWDGNREEGRLDSRRFVAAVNGRTDVFKQRTDAPELDTAILLLIDLSGSMHGNKMILAQQAAIMLTEAISAMAPTCVLGFDSTTDFRKDTGRTLEKEHDAGQRFSRTEPIDMYIFKDFKENLRQAKNALGNITRMCGGNNCDGEALLYAYQLLAARQEKKKVMIVLSDGFPATGTDFGRGHLEMHLAKAVKMIARKSEIIGIGIMSDAVSQFYPKHVVLNKIEELSGAVLEQLARVMLGDKTVMDNSKLIKV